MSILITIADLKQVYKATFEARNEWKNILLELEVSSATIRNIGMRCGDDPKDCYREGLSEWLEGVERSWGDLVEALSSPTVGHGDIAMAIERDYIQSASSTSSITSGKQTADVTLYNPQYQKINKRLTIFTNKKIGSGAFGVVFEGSYRSRPCAVKVLHELATQIRTSLPACQENDETIKAFDRECEFLESFQHLNIVRHLSTDEHPMSGSTILVTELMDCNLRSYLSGLGEESLSFHCQLSLSKDVASGLAYIHSRRIIHRDLCGDNILLSLSQPVPVAKVSDFGMSRLLDPSQMSSTLTAIAHRMGYLPPEALRLEGDEYDHSLDVFSLGVIMVQIVRKVETVKTAKDRSYFVSQIPTIHRLKPIISDCLKEDMRERPTASFICTTMERELIVEENLKSIQEKNIQVELVKDPVTMHTPPPLPPRNNSSDGEQTAKQDSHRLPEGRQASTDAPPLPPRPPHRVPLPPVQIDFTKTPTPPKPRVLGAPETTNKKYVALNFGDSAEFDDSTYTTVNVDQPVILRAASEQQQSDDRVSYSAVNFPVMEALHSTIRERMTERAIAND